MPPSAKPNTSLKQSGCLMEMAYFNENGLYLEITPSGSKENRLVLGVYCQPGNSAQQLFYWRKPL
jgi:hypothetical protein